MTERYSIDLLSEFILFQITLVKQISHFFKKHAYNEMEKDFFLSALGQTICFLHDGIGGDPELRFFDFIANFVENITPEGLEAERKKIKEYKD